MRRNGDGERAGVRGKPQAALAQDPAHLRAVAVLPFDAPVAEIERLHALGVRGVRSNIVDLKFDGYVAQEFIPTWDDKIAALRHAVRLCDV